MKENGKVVEKPYKVGGLYSRAIVNIVYWLQKAAEVAETSAQRAYIAKLIEFYTTGSLKTFDEYSIMWAEDTKSQVDFINGFIESYGDPLGMTASGRASSTSATTPLRTAPASSAATHSGLRTTRPSTRAFKKRT